MLYLSYAIIALAASVASLEDGAKVENELFFSHVSPHESSSSSYDTAAAAATEDEAAVTHTNWLRNEGDVSTTPWLGDSCFSQTTCTDCYGSSSMCHWCGEDSGCHALGSIHGCAWGESCSRPDNNKPKGNNETDDHGCYAQTSCSDCALLSRFCHWCAHDNMCHVIGSVYGCVTGVDCFSNERCKRKDPVRLEDPLSQYKMLNVIPLLAVCGVAFLTICCASLCCGLAAGVKGAYDDLADITVRSGVEEAEDGLRQPLLAHEPEVSAPAPSSCTPEATAAASDEGVLAVETETLAVNEVVGAEDGHHAPTAAVDHLSSVTNVVEPHSLVQTQVLHPTASARRVVRPRNMERLYKACLSCYLITIVTMVIAVAGTILYYPKSPQYNVCNDAVAWKSLMDSLASMKVTADFEILMSVANPNRFDVALDMGKGSFTHNGVFVGTFDIPPLTARAMSITDAMIIAHLSPEKWEVLSLTTDYYRGKLVLDVEAHTTLRIPAFFDYTFAVSMPDIIVRVNEMSDRHLCACPTWNSPNQTRVHADADLEFLHHRL